jgi:hypothetical protein
VIKGVTFSFNLEDDNNNCSCDSNRSAAIVNV